MNPVTKHRLRIFRVFRLLALAGLFLTPFFSLFSGTREGRSELPILYPFPKAGKFGFIDRNGQWVIPPRFDLCNEIFVGDRVLVQADGHNVYIDRKGEPVKQPDDPPWGPGWENPGSRPPGAPFWQLRQSASGFLVGASLPLGRVGLWKRSGEPVLPPEYVNIFITEDRAWVLDANKLLGVYSLDGKWVLKPSIPWESYDLPESLQDGVAWYKPQKRWIWGLISRDGVVVSPPQFLFNAPFKNGVAMVCRNKPPKPKLDNAKNPPAGGGESPSQGGGVSTPRQKSTPAFGEQTPQVDWLVISAEGKELASLGTGYSNGPGYSSYGTLQPWGENLSLVSFEEPFKPKKKWLLDRDGKKILEADRISDLAEGLAVVEVREGSGLCSCGFINARGEVAIPFGVWADALPFSEGLAAVLDRQRGWGFIDTQGRVTIPPKYQAVNGFNMGRGLWTTFVDGVAAVSQDYTPPNPLGGIVPRMYWGLIDREGHELTPRVYDEILGISEGLLPCRKEKLWGYLDKSGREAIPLQFGQALPFYRGRAWVLKAGAEPGKPFWAVIDAHGKLLTDYAWRSPGNRVVWEPKELEELRWCGDFLRMPVAYKVDGLATADGKVVVPPGVFDQFRDLREGNALGINRSPDRKKQEITLINPTGPVAATKRYTDITQFADGSAWATQRWRDYTDRQWITHDDGWWLIDSNGRELTPVRYARPDWVWATASIPSEPKQGQNFYSGYPCFFGDLAPVVPAEGIKGGAGQSFSNAWGYVNRAGKIIAWYEPPTER